MDLPSKSKLATASHIVAYNRKVLVVNLTVVNLNPTNSFRRNNSNGSNNNRKRYSSHLVFQRSQSTGKTGELELHRCAPQDHVGRKRIISRALK